MRRVLALGASLCLFSAADDAQAATFTPDMWVYEITLTAKALQLDVTSFQARATMGSDPGELHSSCSASQYSSTLFSVECYDQSNLPGKEIDPLATVDPSFATTHTARIGFNASQVVCEASLVAGCPTDGKNSVGSPSFAGPSFFTDVVLDAVAGNLSYCGLSIASALACYQLSPHGVVVSGNQSQAGFTDLVFLNIGNAFGFWDYGLGGTWSASPDSFFLFSGTGELLSSPTVIPVPAPVLMLGSGLAAMAGLAFRDRRRRRLLA